MLKQLHSFQDNMVLKAVGPCTSQAVWLASNWLENNFCLP